MGSENEQVNKLNYANNCLALRHRGHFHSLTNFSLLPKRMTNSNISVNKKIIQSIMKT